MEQPKRGRPKKLNAKKSGDLKKGLVRFTFIVEKTIVFEIKKEAELDGITVKNLMHKMLSEYLKNRPSPSQRKNENLLKEYINRIK